MGTYLELNQADFRTHFGRRAFRIGHHLVGHPLFELPALLELSKALPENRVEYNAGNVPVGLDPTQTPQTGLSIQETIRRIEECGSWMVLKNVEKHPDYARLLGDCLDEVRVLSERIDRGMGGRVGFIFVSSPGAVTPIHIDPEYNFLLQIRGSKTVHMWDPTDRSILPEQFLEGYFGTRDGHRNLPYKDDYIASAWINHLDPGEGLHFPYLAPHWVKNDQSVSISFSITFQTPATEHRNLAYTINSRLRRIGMQPHPVGQSFLRDAAKRVGYNVLQSAKRLIRSGKAEAEPEARKY